MNRSSAGKWLPRLFPFLLTFAVGNCMEEPAETEPEEDQDSDSATLRAAAKEQWYNERAGEDEVRRSGPFTTEYRRFLLQTADQERL
jgi:hypothetical protein